MGLGEGPPTTRRALFADGFSKVPARRYCIWDAPAHGPARSLVVHVPAFAEEMNKCRRMTALQARALAARGCGVLRVDLFGCGDSGGDFADATWQTWIEDVVAACELAHRLHREAWPAAPAPGVCLWAVRAGALLAAAAAPLLPHPVDLLVWQPQVAGKLVLQQFLRIKLAASMAADPRAIHAQLREDLARGRSVDVAGYMLPASMAQSLEAAAFDPPIVPGRLHVIEVASGADEGPLPATLGALERWRSAGWAVSSEVVCGKPFWSTVEVEEVPALIEATGQWWRA